MSEVVRNKQVVERFNRYESYRKSVKGSGRSFTEKLEEKASTDESKKTQRRRSSSRPEAAAGKTKLNLGKAKRISQKHAKRLAKYAPLIEKSARKHNVPVELICGVILQESGGRSNAVSHCGAQGLMQLMPATAKRFGVKNSFDAKQNIDAGTKYLSWLIKRFDGDIELALAGYNAGEGNVEKYGNKIPPFKETQAYVPNVLGYTQSLVEIFQATIARTEVPEYARRA
jgi:soluble lytic murein transglycosylase-like protein